MLDRIMLRLNRSPDSEVSGNENEKAAAARRSGSMSGLVDAAALCARIGLTKIQRGTVPFQQDLADAVALCARIGLTTKMPRGTELFQQILVNSGLAGTFRDNHTTIVKKFGEIEWVTDFFTIGQFAQLVELVPEEIEKIIPRDQIEQKLTTARETAVRERRRERKPCQGDNDPMTGLTPIEIRDLATLLGMQLILYRSAWIDYHNPGLAVGTAWRYPKMPNWHTGFGFAGT